MDGVTKLAPVDTWHNEDGVTLVTADFGKGAIPFVTGKFIDDALLANNAILGDCIFADDACSDKALHQVAIFSLLSLLRLTKPKPEPWVLMALLAAA